MKYAEHTRVSVEKSKGEIETLLQKNGATEYVSGWNTVSAQIIFHMNGKRIKFHLPFPDKNSPEFQFKRKSYKRTEIQSSERYEQACRQKWRSLLLAIKAKLESVSSGISTFEEEFLPYFVVPGDGRTVGEIMIPQLETSYQTGNALPLLL